MPCALFVFHFSTLVPLSSSPKWVNFSEEFLRHLQRSRYLLWKSFHVCPYIIDDRFSRSSTLRCQGYFTKHCGLSFSCSQCFWYVYFHHVSKYTSGSTGLRWLVQITFIYHADPQHEYHSCLLLKSASASVGRLSADEPVQAQKITITWIRALVLRTDYVL